MVDKVRKPLDLKPQPIKPIVNTAAAEAPTEDVETLGPTPEEAPVSSTTEQPDVQPVTGGLDPETDTVEGRLNKLTASGSKYVEQARKDTMREANTRGLVNSTMAAGAGTEAAIRQALPIAQQDAQAFAERSTLNQNTQNEFLKNEQSAALNKEIAAFENLLGMEKEAFSAKLKTDMEKVILDEKLSGEMKLQYVATINNITRDAQQQIVDIGMSDRSAAQQATAIALVEANRDASLAVYQDLLGEFSDWNWGTDFTPDKVAPTNVIPEGAVSDGKGGYYWPEGTDTEGYNYSTDRPLFGNRNR